MRAIATQSLRFIPPDNSLDNLWRWGRRYNLVNIKSTTFMHVGTNKYNQNV
jgi:hypothetical protein